VDGLCYLAGCGVDFASSVRQKCIQLGHVTCNFVFVVSLCLPPCLLVYALARS
jgi:hypothetical protein